MMYQTLALLQASEKRYKTQLGHVKAVPLPEVANGLPSEQVTTIHIDYLASLLLYLVTSGGITSTLQCGGASHHHQSGHCCPMLRLNLCCAATAISAVLHA